MLAVSGALVFGGYQLLAYGWSQIRGSNVGFFALLWPGALKSVPPADGAGSEPSGTAGQPSQGSAGSPGGASGTGTGAIGSAGGPLVH
jgi:hypothetical protein